jgi:hypothetical protein
MSLGASENSIKKFDGSVIFSHRGFLIFLAVCLLSTGLYQKVYLDLVLSSMLLFSILGLLSISIGYLHYFEIDEEYFIIRNHTLFWRKRKVIISDIQQIEFSYQHIKMPIELRITVNNLTKSYKAGQLRDKAWLEMEKTLTERNIKVKNEVVFKPVDISFWDLM